MKLSKISLYINTIKYMKPIQIRVRISNILKKKLGFVMELPVNYYGYMKRPEIFIKYLDDDPDYLSRFSIIELLENRITLLHESHSLDLEKWKITDIEESNIRHLWLYNLQYMEYLIPLALKYKENHEEQYLNKVIEYIATWIECFDSFPSGDAWAPYTISLRVINWLIVWDILGDDLVIPRFKESIFRQYKYLQKNTELHLLGNHYLENLKCLYICSEIFEDIRNVAKYSRLLEKELDEQILHDGMHFELSFMYHKIVMEDLIRVIRAAGDTKFRKRIYKRLEKMCIADYSIERGLVRTPHFNDAASNISKSSSSLLKACGFDNSLYDKKNQIEDYVALPKAGYYRFDTCNVSLIIDASEIGPSYIPGHGHNDFGSFELFLDGKPVLVNSGTYHYQDKNRGYYRSTKAHNTFTVNGNEQSQCWGEHRVAKRLRKKSSHYNNNVLEIVAENYLKQQIKRAFYFETVEQKSGAPLTIHLCDFTNDSTHKIRSYIHIHPDYKSNIDGNCVKIHKGNGECVLLIKVSKEKTLSKIELSEDMRYSEEFGLERRSQMICIEADGELKCEIVVPCF